MFCGTRNTMVYAVLAKPTLPPCMRHSQHYPSLVCGTRNTAPPVYAVLATLLLLVCGTRNIVLGGTRHTTYSCDVLRYSRHFSVVMRHSQLYSFHVLFSDNSRHLVLLAVLAPLLTHVLLRYSHHDVVMHT